MKIGDNSIEQLNRCLQGKKLYLFGASQSAKGFIERNQDMYRITGIFDNNEKKWGSTFEGYPVFRISDLKTLDREKTVFLITSVYDVAIENQLTELGFKNIYSSHKCEKRGYNWLEPIKEEDLKYIQELRECLYDDKSKEKLDCIVKYREDHALYWNEIFDGEAYFNDVIQLTDKEVYVDGGAYTGDTIAAFLEHVEGKFTKIYAFEPDPVNYEKLVKEYGTNPKVVCEKSGLWNENTSLRFNDFNTDGSNVSEDGKLVISVKSLDKYISETVSYIKMDIEGSELEALEGAQNIIKRDKPKLAVCIYHKYDDLWKIPLYIKKLVPEYKLYIRHHAYGCSDTVLYAVCE